MLNLLASNQYNNLTFKSSENCFFLNKEPKHLGEIALNLQSLKTGWAHFAIGMAPDFVWDEELGKPARQPSDDYKRAFSIMAIDPKDGKMEWNGAGYGSCAALEDIFTETSKDKNANTGMFVILRYLGSEAKKIGKGNTRIPKFELIGWADPDDLPWTRVENASLEDIPF